MVNEELVNELQPAVSSLSACVSFNIVVFCRLEGDEDDDDLADITVTNSKSSAADEGRSARDTYTEGISSKKE